MELTEKQEEAKRKIQPLIKKCNLSTWKYFSEADTITKFIHPLISALGWNISDFNELREEVACGDTNKERFADIVLYLTEPNAYSKAQRTHAVIEVKSLSYGPIGDVAKSNYNYLKDDLLQKARYFDSTYAILTRFIETVVFNVKTGEEETLLKHIEYLDKIDILWKFLSKPEMTV
jgi:hypothetical protein